MSGRTFFGVFVNRALRRLTVLRWRRGCRRLSNEKLHDLHSVTKIVINNNIRKDKAEKGTCSEIRNGLGGKT
jgi:hypothetical protein